MQSTALKTVLLGGAVLSGSSRSEAPAENLQDVLSFRLTQYYAQTGRSLTVLSDRTLQDVQTETALEALYVVEQVQSHLNSFTLHEPNNEGALLGTRDLAQMRTLFSLVFKWLVEPRLASVCAAIPAISPNARRRTQANIIDLTSVPDDYKQLKDVLSRLMYLVLPRGIQGGLSATVVTSTMVDQHLTDLFNPGVVLGWLPKSLASESVSPVDELRPMMVHLMSMLPVSRCITSLSSILATTSLPYVRRYCSYLLSRQLLRRDGVRGLFVALFWDGDESNDDAPLERLENAARVLQTPPAGMNEVEYLDNVIPQLLSFLSSPDASPMHQRAAAFTLSRLLLTDNSGLASKVAQIVYPTLQNPFLQPTMAPSHESYDTTTVNPNRLSAAAALQTLQTFLTNTDPSPAVISALLGPLIPPLYTLLYRFDKIRSSDPAIKVVLRGILGTWGRLVGDVEGMATLWSVVNGEGGNWDVNVAGEFNRTENSDKRDTLSLFTPDDLRRAEESGEFDVDTNLLDLNPDPVHFVAFLKSLDRAEIVSELFVELLDAYQTSKSAVDPDPLRTLLLLQLVVQMQQQLASDNSSAGILKRPDHILTFVKHALETATAAKTEAILTEKFEGKGLRLDDLRIVDVEDDPEEDSDDENEKGEAGGGDEDMTSTALNLLLSILEANPNLSMRNSAVLDDIFSLLEKLARGSSEELNTLTREAIMVLIARSASSSTSTSSKAFKTLEEERAQETYQKALKLLQDPLLPVRAHGLFLLRQLASSRKTAAGQLSPPPIDRALIPGILSIFLQFLQEDDSYLFLNAVQGLAAMVDGFGQEVLAGVVEKYANNLDGIAGTTLTKQDVDLRTRVGEVLGQVIRRSGEALPKYIDNIAPPLLNIMRSSHLPAALRTSSVSLLAQCVNTSTLAMLPYATDLTAAMVDLLQLESVVAAQAEKSKAPSPPPETSGRPNENDEKKGFKPDSMKFEPTDRDTKLPPLRRSALHLLTLLARALASQVYETSNRPIYILPADLMKRAKLTVGYVAATDEDSAVRVMAKETVEDLDSLAEAMLEL